MVFHRVLDRLYNCYFVAPGVFRSAQPYLGFYRAFLRGHGIKGLINLRGPNHRFGWWRRESAMTEKMGIMRRDVGLSSKRLPSKAVLQALFEAFETVPKPLLLKCSGGQDRTSLASALYLLHEKGAGALAEAEAQCAAWPYLHRPRANQEWIRLCPRFAVEDAEGMALAQWARTQYDPQRFAAWLEAQGFGRPFHGFQDEPHPAS
jgi:hypothetical protein